MDNLESQRGVPESPQQTFRRQILEIEGIINNRYQSKRPAKEAREDALVFAASQLGSCKIEVFSSILQEEEMEDCDRDARRWEEAISGARNDDWSAMRSALQDYARLALNSAATRELLRETDPRVAPGDPDEKSADAFVNLINSL